MLLLLLLLILLDYYYYYIVLCVCVCIFCLLAVDMAIQRRRVPSEPDWTGTFKPCLAPKGLSRDQR